MPWGRRPTKIRSPSNKDSLRHVRGPPLYGCRLSVLRFRLLNSPSYIMSNEFHSSTSILVTSWSTMVTMISSGNSLFYTPSTIS
ncbi:hypothetical protein QL285_086607 [Trifolium repens]|nr:hypothetical protein QL285_086607 [Trifolium repens]